jgi:CheY-like chemotaxis protein
MRSLPSRCCRWFLKIQDRLGSDDLPLTQERLAALLGGGRPRINAVPAALEQDGLLRRHRPPPAAVSVAGALTELVLPDTPKVDIVLLDCLSLHGNIADVLEAARQRSVPVVLISGDVDQAKAVDPALPFVRKPFSREKLLWMLDSARR